MSSLEKPAHSLIARLAAEERVEGFYRYQSLKRRRSVDGVDIWHVPLADRSGVIDTYVRCSENNCLYPLPADVLVHATFRTRLFHDRLVADLIDFDPLVETGDPMLALDRLPRPCARPPEALDQLTELVQGFDNDVLRHAVNLLLANDSLTLPWISGASGLFARGVETAMIAAELPRFSREERELLIVACLFRHTGELALYDDWIRTNGGAPPVPEACLTLELCAPALQWLHGTWPAAANCLRQLWGLGLLPVTYEPHLAMAYAMELVEQLASGKRMKPHDMMPANMGWTDVYDRD